MPVTLLKIILIGILSILICTSQAQENSQLAQPILGEIPQKVEDVFLPEVKGIKVEVWADSLTIPWSLVFLPNGDALVAERPGNIVLIT